MLRPNPELPVVPPAGALKRRWVGLLLLDCPHLRTHVPERGRGDTVRTHIRCTGTAEREQRRNWRRIGGVQHRFLSCFGGAHGRQIHSITAREARKKPPSRPGRGQWDRASADDDALVPLLAGAEEQP